MEKLYNEFRKIYGDGGAISLFFAPGRVNLIGEHTDYNGGYVFPCALSLGTYVAVRKRTDSKVQWYSMNFEKIGVISSDLEDLHYSEADDWANYPKGVIEIFRREGYRIEEGLDILYYGNIPNGAGLSSSASIELVTAVLLKDLYDFRIDMLTMIQISQKAENEFVGVNCGIMDQFAVGLGKQNHALLLDCDTLEFEKVPVELGEYQLIIANTNKRRGLADSKYNERRMECEHALQQLQKELGIRNLGEVDIETFESFRHLIKNPEQVKRARHVVYENHRTKKAAEKLTNHDLEGFGKMMNESHISLRDDYEVTGTELDALVEAAWEHGALGARMTGAGFGGCTINIVERSRKEEFFQEVRKQYKEKTGLDAEFYAVEIGDGAKKIEGVTQ
ncbi:galactokinase [Salimicrobium flavidum]|uniref:Galactokinase n=1 Tax=Salimicrobium flavidum TaxID=570947 RepID=A0A1N7IYY0_9BACI|nr:galactokinase [Salimicrobium flavidum]SIS42315.1 galactokinase [Salimicrobium flavidum]